MPCVNTNLIYLFIMKVGRKALPIAAGSFKAISKLRKGDPFAKLPPKLKAIAMARKALQGGGAKELGRLGLK